MFAGYMFIREDGNGEELEPVELTEQGFPAEGQEVEWEGRLYRVYRVRHVPDANALSDDLNHMVAHVWARQIELLPASQKDGPTVPLIPFTPPVRASDGSFQSAILPPPLLTILSARQLFKCDEYSPSLRRRAPISPDFV
jgi:hypothetical protein